MRIKDFKLIDNGAEQSIVVEFATGEVRTLFGAPPLRSHPHTGP